MKRLIGLFLGIVLVVGMAGLASAQSDSITLKVTCVIGLSVDIPKDEYNFGDVAPKTPTISTEAIVVSNNSGGRTEDYQINCSTYTAAWNLKATEPTDTDPDLFSLQAMFKTTQPSEADFPGGSFLDTGTAGATSQQDMNDTDFGSVGYSGDDVDDGVDRDLWFRLKTPGTTSDTTQQSFSVTITAVNADQF